MTEGLRLLDDRGLRISMRMVCMEVARLLEPYTGPSDVHNGFGVDFEYAIVMANGLRVSARNTPFPFQISAAWHHKAAYVEIYGDEPDFYREMREFSEMIVQPAVVALAQNLFPPAPPRRAGLPCSAIETDWGGKETPVAVVRCITCGSVYTVDPAYNVDEACPFCRSTVTKAVLTNDHDHSPTTFRRSIRCACGL